VDQMQQLCIMVSCPQLGGIEAVLQNVCVRCSFSLCTSKHGWQPVLGACEGCHNKILLPSLALIHGLTGWVAERAERSFSVILLQLISEGLHTHHSRQWHVLVLADGVAPKTLPLSERVERALQLNW